MSHSLSDFALAARISSLTAALQTRKVRVAGRLGAYDPEHALICLDDEDASLLVDISLCLSGYASYPWLREHNSVVMVIGYLETLNHSSGDDTETEVLILRALVMTEQRELDLDVWNSAIDRFQTVPCKNRQHESLAAAQPTNHPAARQAE